MPSSLKLFGFKLRRDTLDPTKHFTIRSIEKTDEAKWIKTLASTKKRKALVFVHGFNTKFRDAVFRAAQITWDLQFRGTTILFSWPSRGDIADYLYDKESALASRTAFLRVIDDLYKAGYDNIDVIAHSMGNLIAVKFLSNSGADTITHGYRALIIVRPRCGPRTSSVQQTSPALQRYHLRGLTRFTHPETTRPCSYRSALPEVSRAQEMYLMPGQLFCLDFGRLMSV